MMNAKIRPIRAGLARRQDAPETPFYWFPSPIGKYQWEPVVGRRPEGLSSPLTALFPRTQGTRGNLREPVGTSRPNNLPEIATTRPSIREAL